MSKHINISKKPERFTNIKAELDKEGKYFMSVATANEIEEKSMRQFKAFINREGVVLWNAESLGGIILEKI